MKSDNMLCKVMLVTLVVMIAVFHQGFCLSCFDCVSNDSWEECDRIGTITNCTKKFQGRNVNASCIKAIRYKKFKNREEWMFMKRCFETVKCNKVFCYRSVDSKEELENIQQIGCDVDCCKDKDFCNGGNKEGLSLYMIILLPFTTMIINGADFNSASITLAFLSSLTQKLFIRKGP
ncbi:uncharacterized protein LOC116305003 [Actinia tenebrosa]|uniref:Uncharacterized protein LOC116305003 n=1 Tax=Actinia tenebrosa TaxID=6105 RepID=A0A6P8ITV9_ACTTE|nr:uncharacterized protein LOC116305003 [Actinia tenebrosa]